MQDSLRHYLQEITRAQEQERKRIARELHDDTAQALYAVNRQVDNFVRSNTNLPPDNVAFLRDLNKQIKEILKDVRRFGQDLRPPMLDDLGLLATLRWLLSELKEQSGIETDLRVVGTERRLPPETEFTLFRIVQEALRNIEKHAETPRAEVEVEFGEGKTRISVSDDGKGFRLSGSLVDLARMGKLGLAGMEERARLLNGSLRIESEPSKGTTVVIEAPV
jgi:signal transduction histidine kinase